MPCYLPNEQGIIASTVEHILTKVVHEGPLTLYVVYNTPPGYEQMERDLEALTERRFAPTRRLRVVNAPLSTSKAEKMTSEMSQQVSDVQAQVSDVKAQVEQQLNRGKNPASARRKMKATQRRIQLETTTPLPR